MEDQIADIVESLPGMESVTGVWEVAERRFGLGDAGFVAGLGIALHERYGSDPDRIWQYRSVFDRLLRLLTVTPGQKNVEQALRLVAMTGLGVGKRARYVAFLLASGQRPEDLRVVFSGGSVQSGAAEELRACLVHELVLRGVVVGETSGIAEWATSPHWAYHPLGWLTLSRSEVERGLDLPSYSAGGSSHAMPFGPSDSKAVPMNASAALPTVTETTTPESTAGMSAAVANWVEESNGQIEARTFQFSEPLATDAVPNALRALGLECLQGLGPRGRLPVSSCTSGQVWRVLFAAASTGGAYSSGLYGAYGRLAAWQALAGLSAATPRLPFADVEQRVNACTWYSFETNTSWFEQVAWDIGLVALTPDRNKFAVLAATDTD